MAMQQDPSRVPLLEHVPKGTSSSIQTLVNTIVSIVGTGVLGLPFAFKVAGWFAASVALILAGALTYYCMMLLIGCRNKLVTEKNAGVKTYGDLGSAAFGPAGRFMTEFLIVVSQCGGAVAYLVFIGHNLSSVFHDSYSPPYTSVIFCLIPIEIALSFIRSLTALAPFSAFADICNVLAVSLVFKEDILLFDGFRKIIPLTDARKLLFSAGLSVFCFEGFGMTLSLEGSMSQREGFKKVLLVALIFITLGYVSFGFLGYLAYGEETKDIITLNLSNNWSAAAVKVGLCIALALTIPIMMHPVYEILEDRAKKLCNNSVAWQNSFLHVIRCMAILALAVTASFVPAFGIFISLVGSTVCAMLSFVLPATFHLIFMGSAIHASRKSLDISIAVFGLAFACYGTYNTVCGLSSAHWGKGQNHEHQNVPYSFHVLTF